MLCLIYTAPSETRHGEEALDFILAASAFDESIKLVFLDDGLLQLCQHQTAEKAELAYTKGFAALADFDITEIYLAEGALEKHGLLPDDLLIKPRIISTSEIRELIYHADRNREGIFNF